MIDIATLKVEVKSDGTAKVTGDLDKLMVKSQKTETQTKKTSKQFGMLDSQLGKTAKLLAGFTSFTVIGATLLKATKSASDFETAMAEVSTLTNSMDMSGLTKQVEALSAQFGQNRITQAKALYQVISAGASTAAEATETLAVANKLAVGGVTDVATAADGLTSAMNAYGLGAESATELSDAMFTAMKAGKTTIGELSQNVGKLAPVAAQAGISFDALMAATAAVTKTGLNTSMTMNSLRQVIVSVVKPTKQAEEAAEALGIEFSSAALESKGLADFLTDIVDKTGGSTVAMSKLFGSVEALQSILFLASETGNKEFNTILDQMAIKSGATTEAFDKMSQSTGFLASVLREQVNERLLAVGTSLLTVLNPALVVVTSNFDELMSMAGTLGNMLLAGALYKGLMLAPTLFMMLKSGIVATTVATKAMTLAMMANPLALLVKSVGIAVVALYTFKDSMVTIGGVTASVGDFIGATWDYIASKLSGFTDGLQGVAAYLSTLFTKDIPTDLNKGAGFFSAFFSNVLKAAKSWVNTFIRIFDVVGKSIGILVGTMVNTWERFWDYLMDLSSAGWDGIQAILDGDLSFTKLKSQLSEGMTQPSETVKESFKQMWAEVSGTDYVGEAVSSVIEVKNQIIDLASSAGDTAEELEEITVTAKRIAPALLETGNAAAEAEAKLAAMAASSDKMGPFEEALVHTAERIDESFSNAWKGAFDSFEDFAGSLKDAFVNMLAELAHLAITRPIVVGITSALGLGGSAVSAASGGDSGLGGITSLLSGAKSILSGGITGLAASGYNFIGDAAQMVSNTGIADLSSFSADAWGAGGNVSLGGMAASAGAGIVGGYAGTQLGSSLFNKQAESAWGATAGGAIGSIWGPLGAGIGAAIGGVLDSAFGSSNSDKTAEYDVNFGNGTQTYTGLTGDKRKQGNEDIVLDLVDRFKSFANLLGGSSSNMKVAFGSRDGLRLDGKDYGNDIDGFLDAGFDKIAESAANLSPHLRDLIQGFEGTAEELFGFAQSMMGLDAIMQVNPVGQAIEDVALAQESAATTAMSAYQEQIQTANDMYDAYDGSSESAQNLAISMATATQSTYELVAGILSLGASLDEMLSDTARNIRESVMSEQQRLDALNAERDMLREQLNGMSDVQQIGETGQRLAELTQQIFNAMDEEAQKVNAEAFATYVEDVNSVIQGKLQEQVDSIDATFSDLQTRNAEIMSEVADRQQAAANDMQAAAAAMMAAANSIPTSIRVDVDSFGETNA